MIVKFPKGTHRKKTVEGAAWVDGILYAPSEITVTVDIDQYGATLAFTSDKARTIVVPLGSVKDIIKPVI